MVKNAVERNARKLIVTKCNYRVHGSKKKLWIINKTNESTEVEPLLTKINGVVQVVFGFKRNTRDLDYTLVEINDTFYPIKRI